jgi:hypothetical protein
VSKSINSILEEASNILLAAMNANEATIGEKTKAFDSLVEYYRAALKLNGKGAEVPDTPSFPELRDRIRGNEPAQ